MGCIYKITNTVNGKAYIGMTIEISISKRLSKHFTGTGNRHIYEDVKKYGRNSFTHEILEKNVFNELLPELEKTYIANFNTRYPHGYNIVIDGRQPFASQSTRMKISEALKGKPPTFGMLGKKHSPETKRKMSESGKNRVSKPFSKGHRENLSLALKGRIFSEEHCRNLSFSNLGRIVSKETREKMSQANKGNPSPNKGKSPSKETREKISQSKRSVMHVRVRQFYFSLDENIPPANRRKILREKFSETVDLRTLRRWAQKWESKEQSQLSP